MEKNQFDSLIDKLDKIIKLLAVQTLKGVDREQDKIELLDSLAFRPNEIAKLLNKSPENVSVVLSTIRKRKTHVNPKTAVQPTTSVSATPTPSGGT